jgi:hypothetical protein
MKQSYLTPSSQVHDFSKFQFAQNQATCTSGTLTLVPFDDVGGACGFRDGASSMGLCLSEAVDPSLLEGWILNLNDGSSVTIAGCVPFDFGGTCTFGISCSVPLTGQELFCVNSIECPDGTLVDACPNQGCQLTVATDSIQG